MKTLSNVVVIVTGAGRGIGAATAIRLAKDGAKVVVNYSTSAKPAEETVAAIKKAGGEAISVHADVSDAASVRSLFDAAEKAFGSVTVLVNNAGVYDMRMVAEEDKAHFEKIIHTNVLGVLLATAEFARRFKESKSGGRVINISSGGARSALPGGAVYCASKAAVEGLTRGHALELGKKGVTETEMLKNGLPEEVKHQMVAATTLGRLGQPEDIADVVAFFAGEDSRWITGQFIDVNGGLKI